MEKYLSGFNLSFGRFSILLSLLESEKKTLNGLELSRKLGIGKTTVSKLVKKLSADRLIESDPSSDDHRVIHHRLTREGLKKLHKIIPGYLQRMRILGSNISVDEKKYLMSILHRINFIDHKVELSQFQERPLREKAEEIKALCKSGTTEDIDRVMEFLDETSDIPLTRVVDYYLGRVSTLEGMKRIEHYLFRGTQIQRNYATLFFARINEWKLVDKAYNMGLIDYIQAYS
ncbi:MAG: MarR family transcriptional regulator, partial [Spirochaetales bacterium]|nr:MarR family transcriptional regulator [Spirochaetales bacterium]